MFVNRSDVYKVVNTARNTGRTYSMIMSLPSPEWYDGKLYIVAPKLRMAQDIIRRIAELRGDDLAKRCTPVASDQVINMRGIDPFEMYFDHTVFEYGSARDIRYIESIIAKQDIYAVEE
jgi:hypothetical protein